MTHCDKEQILFKKSAECNLFWLFLLKLTAPAKHVSCEYTLSASRKYGLRVMVTYNHPNQIAYGLLLVRKRVSVRLSTSRK